MKPPRHKAPPGNDGGCVTPALAQGREFVAGRDSETKILHRSIAAPDEPAAADAAVALDAAPFVDLAAGHPGIDIEPMRERMDKAARPRRNYAGEVAVHHSHPAHHTISTMATQNPADSATMTGRATRIGRRASVAGESMYGSVRAVIRTSAMAQ